MEITFYRKIASKVADAVLSSQEYSEAEAKRIRYGLVCIFSDLYKFLLMLLIFFLFSSTVEYLEAFVAVLILRPVLGGYHAKSEVTCIFVSLATMVVSVFVGKLNIVPEYIELGLIAALPVIGILIAPVRTKKVQENKRNYKILAVILTASLILLDYFFIPYQVTLVSIIIVYLLSIYQLLKNIYNGI